MNVRPCSLLKLFTGDLFADDRVTAFAHGCNCAGAMGKGIAVAFKERWPAMYEEYRRRCQAGEFQPGDLFVWEADGVVVYNLGTQKTWRTKATMEAVETSVKAMIEDAEGRGLGHVALPTIGAGLGGLDWIEVKAALERLAHGSSVELWVCEEFVAGQKLLECFAHQDLDRKRIIKLARQYEGVDMAALMGADEDNIPFLLKDPTDETHMACVWNAFNGTMAHLDEDSVRAHATVHYLLSIGVPEFETMAEIEAHADAEGWPRKERSP